VRTARTNFEKREAFAAVMPAKAGIHFQEATKQHGFPLSRE
jgi:hypothetical protein